jgi:DNA polymerase
VAQAKVADWLAQAIGPNAASGAASGRAAVASALSTNAPNAAASTTRVPVEALTMTPEARKARLSELEQEVRGCQKCGLCAKRTQTVFSRGTGSSGLCFVGEGPGADEDQQGYPFVGAAGQLLDRMIAAMGLIRDEVYVCNIVKCRPPENRKPDPSEMRACLPYLEEQLELLAPEVIVALGATAVEGLLGISGGITRLRGNWKLYRGKTAVMPTFHPAYLLRAPSAKHVVWDDMKAVLRHLGRTVPERGKKPQ